MSDIAQELRVMHACENGAIGVYRGHKCVARYFYRKQIEKLDEMRLHEKGHANIFQGLLKEYGSRKCYLSSLWFFGGLLYGVAIGAFGIKAIGISTLTIEKIVDSEIEVSINNLKEYPNVCKILRNVQIEEREHAACGEVFSNCAGIERSKIATVARLGAYAAKNMAILL